MDDSLLLKNLMGHATPDEASTVQQWLEADPENRIHYDHIREIWEESRKLATSGNISEEAAWQRFRKRVGAGRQEPAAVKRSGWLRVAALLVLVAGLGYLTFLYTAEEPAREIVLASAQGILNDTLPDGSLVTLNKNSRLVYPEKFEAGARQVLMEGEAFFDVAPDKDRPFVIKVSDISVKVVGTSFNIRSGGDSTEVIVETGIVEVRRGGQMAVLRPMEKLLVRANDTTFSVQEQSDRLYNYYYSRELVCDNTPLWKFIQVLNRAYDANIVIEREELKKLPLDASFTNESLDVILEIIRQTFYTYGIEIVKTKNKIILR